jgi:hypothetical protein
MVRSPSQREQDPGGSSSGNDHVRTTRNLPLGDDPISFVGGTIRLPARHRLLHGWSWRFPFDCGAKTGSRHDQSANCQSRCKRCAPRLRQVILPEVWLLQLKENSNVKEETKTREDRGEAAPARVPALIGVATLSTAGSGGAETHYRSGAGIQNTLAKNQSNSGGFTLGRRGVGRQA